LISERETSLTIEKTGFLSSTAWLLILISFFQKLEILPNLQEFTNDLEPDEKLKRIEKNTYTEKRPNELKGLLKKQNLKFENQLDDFDCDPDSKAECISLSSKVNFYIASIDDGMVQRKQQLMHKTKTKYRVTEIDMFGRFLKFFASKVQNKFLCFNVKKKRVESKRSTLYISVKDPFIKQLNHGASLQKKENF